MTKKELKAEFKTWKPGAGASITVDHRGGSMKARIFVESDMAIFPGVNGELLYYKFLCRIRYPNTKKVDRLKRWLREFQEEADDRAL